MDYRIIDKPAVTLIGKTLRVSTSGGDHLLVIPRFWEESGRDGTIGALLSASGGDSLAKGAIVGVCADFSADQHEFTYLIAVEKGEQTRPPGMVELTVPALTWAVFDAVGLLPDSIQSVWKAIFSEFFSAGVYQHADGPELEIYPPGDKTVPDYRCEVWIPVTKK